MRHLPLVLLGCVLAFGFAALADEKVTVDGAVVTVPDGWKRADKDDQVVFTPRDLPAGAICTLTLLGGVPYKGAVKDQMEAEWAEIRKLGTMAADSETEVRGEGGPVEVAIRAGRIDNAGRKSAFVLFFVAKANDRVERMIVVADDGEAMRKYGGEAAQMVLGAQYVMPQPPAALSGVCLGFVQVKTSLRHECWIFMPDGTVLAGCPYGGPADMDFALQAKRHGAVTGTYKTDGADAVVVTLKGAAEPTRFAVSKEAWAAPVVRKFQDRYSSGKGLTISTWTDDVPTTLRLVRAEPCDGLKLSGTYKRDFGSEEPTPTIRFADDGTFAENGLIRRIDPGTLDAAGKVVKSAAPERGGGGTYAVAKNTLTLTYQDGTRVGLTFLVAKAALEKRAPAALYVHEVRLVPVP